MVFQIFKKKNIINKLHIISTVHVICFIIFDPSYQKKKFLTNFTISSYLNLNQDDEIPINKYANDIVKDLESIHCYWRACAFIKK